MEQWEDQGIVLSVRAHGENGAIVGLLTQAHGRYSGYVRGIHSKRMRGALEVGNLLEVQWKSRIADQLGFFDLSLVKNNSVNVMGDGLRLGALQAACALCDAALPDREAHEGLFNGTLALFDALRADIWGAAYVMWELAFLRELGFSLDLSRCGANSGDPDLIYVSPKTGRAVSRSAGAPYKEKLLALPGFLSPAGGEPTEEAIEQGLDLCAYFLEHWAFTHHSSGIPADRLRFGERFAKSNVPQSAAV